MKYFFSRVPIFPPTKYQGGIISGVLYQFSFQNSRSFDSDKSDITPKDSAPKAKFSNYILPPSQGPTIILPKAWLDRETGMTANFPSGQDYQPGCTDDVWCLIALLEDGQKKLKMKGGTPSVYEFLFRFYSVDLRKILSVTRSLFNRNERKITYKWFLRTFLSFQNSDSGPLEKSQHSSQMGNGSMPRTLKKEVVPRLPGKNVNLKLKNVLFAEEM